jgi:hypothetical protein
MTLAGHLVETIHGSSQTELNRGPVFASVEAMGLDTDHDSTCEAFAVVAGSRLIYVNKPALRSDLSLVSPHCKLADECLDSWLLAAGSVISQANAKPNDVNSLPQLTDRKRIGYRPPRYGRAAVFDVPLTMAESIVSQIGLAVDVKGCGVDADQNPSRVRRGSGTLLLHEAIQELLNSRLLSRVFEQSKLDVTSLPIYALVDLGIVGWCSYFATEMPCVTMLRRAHLRPTGNDEIPSAGSDEELAKHQIELALRRFGISSAPISCSLDILGQGENLALIKNGELIPGVPPVHITRLLLELGIRAPCKIRMTNVQLTRGTKINPLSATLVDFGHYTSESTFVGHHLVTLVNDRPFNWGLFLRETDADWVQPEQGSLVNQKLLGPVQYPAELAKELGYELAFRRLRPGVELAAVKLALKIQRRHLGVDELEREISAFIDQAIPGRSHLKKTSKGGASRTNRVRQIPKIEKMFAAKGKSRARKKMPIVALEAKG